MWITPLLCPLKQNNQPDNFRQQIDLLFIILQNNLEKTCRQFALRYFILDDLAYLPCHFSVCKQTCQYSALFCTVKRKLMLRFFALLH